MLSLLNFFEETTEQNNNMGTIYLIVIGVVLVGMVVFSFISRKKEQKKNDEMMASIQIGVSITTIGGIVGEIVKLDNDNIWIATGTDDNKCVVQLLRRAIAYVNTPENTPQSTEEEVADEIK